MKITETIERECCKPVDMQPVHGTPLLANGSMYRFMFCRHCGHQQVATFKQDHDGGEYIYERLPVPWWKP